MNYIYPAIFTPDKELEDYYVVEFPDIDVAVTQGENFSDAYRMAEDVLNLVLMTMENEGEEIPVATALESIDVDGDKIVGLIEADTAAYRKTFQDGLSCHDVWYSPITERKFFVLKDDDREVCKYAAKLLSKVSGVNLGKFYE